MFKSVGKALASRRIAALAPRMGIQFARPSPLAFKRAPVSASPVRFSHSTPIGKIDKPTYQLTFTCKACTHRSSHLVSKQAYHKGTVLVQCPDCKNRHLIADHLNVFGQGKKTLEDILKEKGDGETVTTHTIDLNKLGDIEWEGPDQKPEQHLLDKEKKE